MEGEQLRGVGDPGGAGPGMMVFTEPAGGGTAEDGFLM